MRGFNALYAIAKSSEDNCAIVVSAGGPAAIVAALNARHSHLIAANATLNGLYVLNYLMDSFDNVSTVVVKSRGPAAIVAALLTTDVRHKEVVQVGIETLRILARIELGLRAVEEEISAAYSAHHDEEKAAFLNEVVKQLGLDGTTQLPVRFAQWRYLPTTS
jgi:hypothetical protein